MAKFIWVCKVVGGKVCQGMLGEIPLPPEMVTKYSEYYLKMIKVAGAKAISYQGDETRTEIIVEVPEDKETEFIQKLADMVKKDKLP